VESASKLRDDAPLAIHYNPRWNAEQSADFTGQQKGHIRVSNANERGTAGQVRRVKNGARGRTRINKGPGLNEKVLVHAFC